MMGGVCHSDHGGFAALPEQCGHVLDQVLTQAT